jgi:hypothetical protein
MASYLDEFNHINLIDACVTLSPNLQTSIKDMDKPGESMWMDGNGWSNL